MITGLHITNYQSHKDTGLAFSKGINAIVGVTDSGKSGIFRALDWVCNNNPSSGSPSWWADDDMQVELQLDDCLVVRKKGKQNLYELYTPTTEGELSVEQFKSFGQGVPDAIQTAINLSPVNWQSQFDSHFLLSNTPGEVARRLNEVAHLEVIDIGTANIASMIRRNNSALTLLQEELGEDKEAVEAFSYLPKLEKLVNRYETAEQKKQVIVEDREEIHRLVTGIRLKKKESARAKRILGVKPKLEELVKLADTQEFVMEKMVQLGGVLQELEQLNRHITELEEFTAMKKVKLAEAMPDECPLCGQEIKN